MPPREVTGMDKTWILMLGLVVLRNYFTLQMEKEKIVTLAKKS
jgi:hypothetical protein